ncbi:MAG TPA: hypothetical protein ENI87_09995 [bacterium]|nr:hypothetical protein [bacterium]
MAGAARRCHAASRPFARCAGRCVDGGAPARSGGAGVLQQRPAAHRGHRCGGAPAAELARRCAVARTDGDVPAGRDRLRRARLACAGGRVGLGAIRHVGLRLA